MSWRGSRRCPRARGGRAHPAGRARCRRSLRPVRAVPRPPAQARRRSKAPRQAHGPDRDRIAAPPRPAAGRSEEHTSELQSLMRISYAVFCLKKKTKCIFRSTYYDYLVLHTTQPTERKIYTNDTLHTKLTTASTP